MKENMYTYHYFQNRVLKRPSRAGGVIFHMALLCSTVYIVAVLVSLVK